MIAWHASSNPSVRLRRHASNAAATLGRKRRACDRRYEPVYVDRDLPPTGRLRTVTIVATSRLRIYRLQGEDFGAEYYACWRATGRSRVVTMCSSGADVTDFCPQRFIAAGRFVGFLIRGAGEEYYDRFTVVNARTGRRVHDSGKIPAPEDPGDRAPVAILVSRSGTMVWLATNGLHATDGTGTRMLASPAGGEIRDVALAARTVYWTQAGQPMSATIR
jgi:hypothetical protein